MNKIISKLFVTIILLAIMPVVCAGPNDNSYANCDDETPPHEGDIFEPNVTTVAAVDGFIDEWNTDDGSADFVKNMSIHGSNPNDETLTEAYFLYDKTDNTLYVMVLSETGVDIDDGEGVNHLVKDICTGEILVNNSPSNILSNNFIYISVGGNIIGWEASISFDSETYGPPDYESPPYEIQLRVQTQVDAVVEEVSEVSGVYEPWMGRCIFERPDNPEIPIPEFPTIALPIAAILGLMFILQSRRRKED